MMATQNHGGAAACAEAGCTRGTVRAGRRGMVEQRRGRRRWGRGGVLVFRHDVEFSSFGAEVAMVLRGEEVRFDAARSNVSMKMRPARLLRRLIIAV